MAKHYPQKLWDAIRAYWENTNASYSAAAEAVGKGEETPNKSAISSRAKAEGWVKKHIKSDGQSDVKAKTDGQSDVKRIHKKADLLAIASDSLAEVILQNEYLSPKEIDEVCEDFKAAKLKNQREDFDEINAVVNKCVFIFKKIVDVLHDGGRIEDNNVIERNGFVHEGMMLTMKTIEFTLKALLSAATIKNVIQTNERKSYGLETYEETSQGGDLSKKALSQTGMGNHYERIRLGKPDEKSLLKNRLKDKV